MPTLETAKDVLDAIGEKFQEPDQAEIGDLMSSCC